jgi:hypothetical protein
MGLLINCNNSTIFVNGMCLKNLKLCYTIMFNYSKELDGGINER